MKKYLLLFILVTLTAQGQIKKIAEKAKNKVENLSGSDDVGQGLKEALQQGVDKQVAKLTALDGFFRNELVKIGLPKELQPVEKTLKAAGLSNLNEQGLLLLNRAAEDAVKEAIPIFKEAIMGISFTDAKKILMGSQNAATVYLEQTTKSDLYNKFSPVVKRSFEKVGADKIWASIITKYNKMPLTNDVNPDLTDYVTHQALTGVFTMLAIEEKDIRTNFSSRTSALLKKVFAAQDKK